MREIRAFRAGDTDAVMEIWLDASLRAHDFIPAAYWREHAREVREDCLPAARTWVLAEDGAVRGFISVLEGGYIGGLFVSPARRRGGMGTELLAFCQRRYPLLELAVYLENEGARAFYRARGFVEAGERVSDCPPHREALMRWAKNGV